MSSTFTSCNITVMNALITTDYDLIIYIILHNDMFVAGYEPEDSQAGDICEGNDGGPFVMKVRIIWLTLHFTLSLIFNI